MNLNIHVHALVIDSVFAEDSDRLLFHPAGRLRRDDLAAVVAVAGRRIERVLPRRAVMATAEEHGVADIWTEEAPVLAGLAAASVWARRDRGYSREGSKSTK